MKEADRQQVIHKKVASMQPQAPVVLPTGFQVLDEVLAGGWPRGRIVEMFGPSSSGKTTLALQSIAHLQEHGGAAAWIDADHTFDPAYAAALGVAIEVMPVLQPDSAEQALEIASRLAASQGIDLLVIDSAAALAPQLELDYGLGESGSGLHSRVLASGLRRLSRTALNSDTELLFLPTRLAPNGILPLEKWKPVPAERPSSCLPRCAWSCSRRRAGYASGS